MMLLHSYGSAVFTAAVLTTCAQLLLLLVVLVAHFWKITAGGQDSSSSSSSAASWQQLLWSVAAGSLDGSSSSSVVRVQQLLLSCTSLSTWLFVSLTASSLAAIHYMVQQVLRLFRVLSPDASAEVLQPRISLCMLWLGWVLENTVLPFCMLYSFCCDRIEWGGIRYHKQGGKVVRVVHP
jgi:hypothetical protein